MERRRLLRGPLGGGGGEPPGAPGPGGEGGGGPPGGGIGGGGGGGDGGGGGGAGGSGGGGGCWVLIAGPARRRIEEPELRTVINARCTNHRDVGQMIFHHVGDLRKDARRWMVVFGVVKIPLECPQLIFCVVA